jgi:hypothetical protein
LDAAVLVEAGSQTTNADASIDPLHTDSDATTSNTTPTTPDASSVSDASDATDSGAHVPQDAAALDGGPPSVEQPDAIAAECGDGILQAPEVCDGAQSTSTELGACNPQCAGHFEKKYVRATSERYSGALGGPSGADAICVEEFGDGWKALLSGGTRRATVTPNEGDATTDWVVQPYTHYYNWDEALIWRTDDVPLLGVRDGERQNLYAPLFDESSGYYAWSGFRADWTTVEDDEEQAVGNCLGWTDEGTAFGTFIKPELDEWFSDYCGSKWGLLCVEQ